MLWSIDGCQNKVSADQYHLTVSRPQVSTDRDRVLFWSYPLTTYWFSNDRRLNFIFLKFISKMCLYHYGPALLRFWFQPDLGRQNLASFLRKRAGKTFSYHGHALVTFYVQFFMLWLVKIWQVSSCKKFMQHLKSCLVWQLKLAEFLCQLVMFFTVFFHWMYQMKYSGYQESSVIHR